jgi:type II secretory pathway component PulF
MRKRAHSRRDEAVSEAEQATKRALQLEGTMSRLQAEGSKRAELSQQLAGLLQQNRELASQLQSVTQQHAQVRTAVMPQKYDSDFASRPSSHC